MQDDELVARALAEARFKSDDQDAFDEVDQAFARILRNRPDEGLRGLLARWAAGSEPAGAGSRLEADTLDVLGGSATGGATVGLVLVLTTRPERAGMPNEAKAMMTLPRPLAEDLKMLPTAIEKLAGPQLIDAMANIIREDTCPSCGGSFGGFGYMPNDGRRGDCDEPRHS
jgi:hypothetical protein